MTGVVNAGFDASINFDPSAVAELNNITVWSAASNFYANQDTKMYSSQPLDAGRRAAEQLCDEGSPRRSRC